MGANRRAQSSPVGLQSTIWTSTQPPTLLAAARAIGVVDFYTAPSGQRSSLKPLRLPSTVGSPTTLSLRPPTAPKTFPLTVTGTVTGHVLLDENTLLQAGAGPVCASYYSDSSIVVVGRENNVILIDPSSRTTTLQFSLAAHHISPITHIVMQSNTHALFCSQTMTIVKLSSGDVKRRFLGHKNSISAVASAPPFAITASDDTFLSVWNIDPSSKDGPSDSRTKRRRTANIAGPEMTLIAPHPNILKLSVSREHKATFTVAALLLSGNIAVWQSCNFGTSFKSGKDSVGVTTPSPASFVIDTGHVYVHTTFFSKKGFLTVLRGSVLKPQSETVDVNNVRAGTNVVLPEVRSDFTGTQMDDTKRKARLREAAASAEVTNASVAESIQTDHKEASFPHPKGNEQTSVDRIEMTDKTNNDLPDQQVNNGPISSGESDINDNDNEPTLEQKLKTLGIRGDSLSATTRPLPTSSSLLEATRLNSRVSVLMQAVRSKDSKMLDACLFATDTTVIRNTIRRIPPNIAAGELLELLVQRLRDHFEKVESLSVWIKAILMEHASAIISLRQNNVITALAHALEDRIRTLDSFSRLQGRLELIVGQSGRLKRTGIDHAVPVAEYEEEEHESSSSGAEEDEEDENENGEEDEEEVGEEGEDEDEDEDGDENAQGDLSDRSEEVSDEGDGYIQKARGDVGSKTKEQSMPSSDSDVEGDVMEVERELPKNMDQRLNGRKTKPIPQREASLKDASKATVNGTTGSRHEDSEDSSSEDESFSEGDE